MRSILAILLAGLFLGTGAQAWGPDGHRMISKLAVAALPDEVPAFVRSATEEIGYLGPEADRERGAGQSFDSEHSPGHFVDVDDDLTIHGGPRLDALPPTRDKYDYELNKTHTNQYRMGYLPYSIVQGEELLAEDFAWWRVDAAGERNGRTEAERAWYARERVFREHIVIHDLGLWSHFVGDGSQPLHVTVHYNGWGKYPNPEGFTTAKIHEAFESPYVHDNVAEKDVAALIPAYRDCGCDIARRTADYLVGDAQQVVPLYRLEKAGAFAKPTPEGKAFVAARLAAGAAELRDMIVDAWRASGQMSIGYPAVKVSDVESGKADPYEMIAY